MFRDGISSGNAILILLIFFIVLYFVIKWAVKEGINTSMLFSDIDRREKYEEDMKTIEMYTKNKRNE